MIVHSPADRLDQRVCDGLYDAFDDAVLARIEAGELPRWVREQLLIPVYFRTLEEFQEPLIDAHSSISRSFRIDRAEELKMLAPFTAEFRRTGDRAVHAAQYTGFFRAFSEPVVRPVIQKATADPAAVDRLYQHMEQLVLTDPDRYPFDYLACMLVLTRV